MVKIDNKSIKQNYIIIVRLAASAINFAFNLMIARAMV